MTVTISNGIVILLLFLQNTFAQHGVNNAQSKATCNTAGVNFNSVQPGQQINWQQPPQNVQQVKQQSQNYLSDLFSAMQGLRFSSQKPQGSNPASSPCPAAPAQLQFVSNPSSNNAQIAQYANPVPESPKPTFTFQFVPVAQSNMAPAPENQVQNSVPVQFMTSGQSMMASPVGPNNYIQNQPSNGMVSQQVPTAQNFQTSSGQPILLAVNSQQPTVQSQPMVYTLQPSQPTSSYGNQQKVSQRLPPNIASDNPMALLMSQLQSPSGNPDLTSFLPMLMNSKQEKSGGMKSILPLILNLLSDRGCGCPNCGCPRNNPEPTINGGYSNQVNNGQQGLNDLAKFSEPTSVVKNEESDKVEFVRAPKKHKTNVASEISEEVSDEDGEYEYDDDDD